MALGWVASQHEASSVLVGATKPEQVVQNAAVASDWKPNGEEVAEISALFAVNRG